MVTKLGMSSSLENISLSQNEYGIKAYSNHTNSLVDIEIHKIIAECSQKCREIISEHSGDLERLSDALIAEETLDLKRITEVLGERPWPMPASVADIINFSRMDEEGSGEGEGEGEGDVVGVVRA